MAGDFRDQLNVPSRLFQQSADVVGECGLADAVRADESQFHVTSTECGELGKNAIAHPTGPLRPRADIASRHFAQEP